jgi:predicted metalloprotease
MRWKELRKSENVKDNRIGFSLPAFIVGTVVGAIYFTTGPKLPETVTKHVTGIDKMAPANFTSEEHPEFIKAVLGSLEDTWRNIFQSKKLFWRDAKLVLFTGTTNSGCGAADSDTGPFYCPADGTVYIDLDFFKMINKNLSIPGDYTQSYVIAHEVGHHVQTLLGTLPKTFAQMQRSGNAAKSNRLLVRLELQADCYAGIWMNQTKYLIEPGDLAEVVNAAARIGDDWLQSRNGRVVPDSFTHGTSAQRAGWLLRGYTSGKVEDCDTFTLTDSVIGQ